MDRETQDKVRVLMVFGYVDGNGVKQVIEIITLTFGEYTRLEQWNPWKKLREYR